MENKIESSKRAKPDVQLVLNLRPGGSGAGDSPKKSFRKGQQVYVCRSAALGFEEAVVVDDKGGKVLVELSAAEGGSDSSESSSSGSFVGGFSLSLDGGDSKAASSEAKREAPAANSRVVAVPTESVLLKNASDTIFNWLQPHVIRQQQRMLAAAAAEAADTDAPAGPVWREQYTSTTDGTVVSCSLGSAGSGCPLTHLFDGRRGGPNSIGDEWCACMS